MPNYITPGGYRRLREEYEALFALERPKLVEIIAWAASNGDRSENGDYIYGKRRLREIDRRIRYLSKSLDRAVVVDNSSQTHERVRFGATVTILDESGDEREVVAVALGAEHLPDVILMDLRLPDMDGIEAARILANGARTAAIPVVALSAVGAVAP